MLLPIAVVWNIVSMSVGDRILEFAQFEALAWSRNTLSHLLFLEIIIVTFTGALASFPTSKILSLMFQGFMELQSKGMITNHLSSSDLLAVVLLVANRGFDP